MKSERRRRAAFTLVEMLVVIAIIAVLAVAMLAVVKGGQEKADATKCQARMRNLWQAAMNYVSDNDFFPCAGSHEVFDYRHWHFEQRQGWVAWTPKNALTSDEKRYYLSEFDNDDSQDGCEKSQAKQFRYAIWGGEEKCTDPLTGTEDYVSVVSIKHGCLFRYADRDLTTYCCPRFRRLIPSKPFRPVRSYEMNYWFGSRRRPLWHPVQHHDFQDAIERNRPDEKVAKNEAEALLYARREPSRMVMFTETYLDVRTIKDGAGSNDQPPSYKSSESKNTGEERPAEENRKKWGDGKREENCNALAALGADGVWDYNAKTGDGLSAFSYNEVYGAPHLKSGRWWGHAVFVDGHIESLEGRNPFGKASSTVDETIKKAVDAGGRGEL